MSTWCDFEWDFKNFGCNVTIKNVFGGWRNETFLIAFKGCKIIRQYSHRLTTYSYSTYPSLEIIEDVDLVVDVQLVVLHEAGGVWVGFLDFPHELPQLGSGLTGPLAEVLADVNVAVLTQFALPQDLLTVFEVLKRHQDWSGARYLRTYKYQMALSFILFYVRFHEGNFKIHT